jgi:hypothetical protein
MFVINYMHGVELHGRVLEVSDNNILIDISRLNLDGLGCSLDTTFRIRLCIYRLIWTMHENYRSI